MKEQLHRPSAAGLRHLAVFCLTASAAAFAETPLGPAQPFDIPAQNTGDALNAFSKQSGLRLLFSYDEVQNARTDAIRGNFTPEEVLQKLLEGTELRYVVTEESVVVIQPARPLSSAITPISTTGGGVAVERLAQADIARESERPEVRNAANQHQDAQDAEKRPAGERWLEEVIVTGTNIRYVTDVFAPVTTVTRDELDRAGLARVGDFIARLPQNFGGGSGTTPDDISMGAQAINLRGLGNEATLTLLNGRRLAPGGLAGEYTDISAIPTAALERVEVLTDGASAIYGSDAVAGVVNFILRKDYNGSETRLRFGQGTEGSSGQEILAAHTVGASGERGRFLLSYEYSLQDALDANDRDFTRSMPDTNEVLPESRRHSVFFSGALHPRPDATLFSDLYYNRRDTQHVFTFSDTRSDDADVEQFGGTFGGTIDFGTDWRAELSGSIARNEFFDRQLITPAPPTNAGIIQGSQTRIWSVDGKIDGPLFQLPGGTARAVFGAQYRDEKHDGGADFFDANGNPLGMPQAEAHTTRDVTALYTELYLPFVSGLNARPGVRQFALSLAGRYEEYSDFGSTFNPKLGLLWSPVGGVTLRGTYGTSFRAPRLQEMVDQVNTVIIADYVDPEAPGGMSVAAWVSGTTSNLDAEESESWTFGIDFEPASVPGLKVRATYFDIEYEGRIAIPQPTLGAGAQLHNYPLPPIRNVDLATLQALVNAAVFPLINFTVFPGGSQSGLEDVTVLLDSRPTNTSRSSVSGLDLLVSHEFTTALGDWSLSLNGSYLFEAEDQFSMLMPVVEKLNTVGNPPDLRIRGSVGLTRGSTSLGLYVNYTDNYRDIDSLEGVKRIGSWTTIDLSARYDFDARFGRGLLSGTALTLSALNVLDRDPPSIDQNVIPGAGTRRTPYDTANADPHGRMVALQITKSW